MDILQITLAFLLSLSIILLLWSIKGFLLRPIIGSGDARVTVTLSADGDAKRLEHLISGLLWLEKNGTLPSGVIIVDCGLTAEALDRARLLEKKHPQLSLCLPQELEKLIIRSCKNGGNT
ncbi:MAG: hypothetical protein RSD32_06020 [Oscillospiraceae bacterium]